MMTFHEHVHLTSNILRVAQSCRALSEDDPRCALLADRIEDAAREFFGDASPPEKTKEEEYPPLPTTAEMTAYVAGQHAEITGEYSDRTGIDRVDASRILAELKALIEATINEQGVGFKAPSTYFPGDLWLKNYKNDTHPGDRYLNQYCKTHQMSRDEAKRFLDGLVGLMGDRK